MEQCVQKQWDRLVSAHSLSTLCKLSEFFRYNSVSSLPGHLKFHTIHIQHSTKEALCGFLELFFSACNSPQNSAL